MRVCKHNNIDGIKRIINDFVRDDVSLEDKLVLNVDNLVQILSIASMVFIIIFLASFLKEKLSRLVFKVFCAARSLKFSAPQQNAKSYFKKHC